VSNKAMAWAVDCKVKGSHKLVLMLIAEAHNGHTGACFPSQEWIEEKSGLADSTVLSILKDLEEWGFLSRHTKSLGRGKGSRRDFELHLETFDPQILDLLNSGVRGLENTQLDPQPARPPLKEEPEREPEVTGNAGAKDDHSEVLKAFWDSSPDKARERSSKKRLSEAVSKIVRARKDVTAEQLLAAWQAFLRTADARKDGAKFCPGIHVWLNDNRFDAFLQAAAVKASPEDDRALKLEQCFFQYGRGGAWEGRHHGFPVAPDVAEAAGLYPTKLYAKYGMKMPEGAR